MNAVKGCQRFSLNLYNISKTPPFRNLLHPWVQKKSQGARSSECGGEGLHHHFVSSQKLLDAQGCVSLFSSSKIAKHTCRHLEKMPEELTRSAQRNVTWQTGSEYRRLTVPSGRTMNYVSFVRKMRLPEIFGSPLVQLFEVNNIII